jgi:hypothetical protein
MFCRFPVNHRVYSIGVKSVGNVTKTFFFKDLGTYLKNFSVAFDIEEYAFIKFAHQNIFKDPDGSELQFNNIIHFVGCRELGVKLTLFLRRGNDDAKKIAVKKGIFDCYFSRRLL